MNRAIRLLATAGVVAVLATAVFAARERSAQANIVNGEYSMELTTAAGSVAAGNTFVVNAGVVHDGSVGAYQAAQWSIGYVNTVVQFTSAVKDAAAPGACFSSSDNTTRTLVGCIDVTGATITYSGVAWDVTYTCMPEGGVTDFTLLGTTGLTPATFVKIGTVVQPIHVHNIGTVTCTPAGAATNTPTVTQTGTPTATATPGSGVVRSATPTQTTPTQTTTPPAIDQTPQPAVTASPAPKATAASPGGGAGAGGVRLPSTGTGPSAAHGLAGLWVALGVAVIGGTAGTIGWRRRALP